MLEFTAIAAITVVAVMSPGPDFAMVSRNSLVNSRQMGLVTALGISLGVWVHIAYTILGIGLVIQNSILLFNLIKLLGAAYLVYLGIKMLRSKSEPVDVEMQDDKSIITTTKAFQMGFLTNALNPKTTLFIVSLFAQVVDPTTPLAIQIGYGLFISGAHLVWFAAVAILFSHSNIRWRLLSIRHWIDRAFGALLVGLGLTVAANVIARR